MYNIRKSPLLCVTVCSLLITLFVTDTIYSQVRTGSARDGKVQERINFIQDRLETTQYRSRVWYMGWTGLYGFASLYSGYNLYTERGNRVVELVNLSRSGYALIMLGALPFTPAFSSDILRNIPGETREQRLQKLSRAEELLQKNYTAALRGRAWYRHLISLVINSVTAVLIWKLVSLTEALVNFAYSMITAELMLLTQPNRPITDLEEYRKRFSTAYIPPGGGRMADWFIMVTGNGIAAGIRF